MTRAREEKALSYQTRQSRRTKKAAIGRAKVEHRTKMESRYYLTVVTRSCRCQRRGERLAKGADNMVYRFDTREVMCRACADRDGIRYRTSESWERLAGKTKPASERARTSRRERGSYTPRALLAELVIEAGCSAKCDPASNNRAWTRPVLAGWGVSWPPPAGWRQQLVRRWSDGQAA